MKLLLSSLVFLLFVSCAQSPHKGVIDESQISIKAKEVIQQSRELVKNKEYKLALTKLVELHDDELIPLEKSLKYNLKGVILCQMNDWEKGFLNFEVADKYAPEKTQLYSQIKLNMASALYKTGRLTEVKDPLDAIDPSHLTAQEVKKYGQIKFIFGEKYQNHAMIVSGQVYLHSDLKTLAEVEQSHSLVQIKESYQQLDLSQKLKLLEEFEKTQYMMVAYLAKLEAEQRYFSGDKDGAKDVSDWLENHFSSHAEVAAYLSEFNQRLDLSSRIDGKNIGIILPLSGDKASFGQRALSTLEASLKIFGVGEDVSLYTKDSADSPVVAGQGVIELIKQNHVAFIIGGLFPETAKAEYLEARKYGVLFISLSPIYLPKEQKNHHLIEVQGSIESQVASLMSDQMLERFGKRMGIIYPENEAGQSYLSEIWRTSETKGVKLTAVGKYPKNSFDYRDPIQQFLGLKYPRERKEEDDFLKDVYSQEKSTIRRVQTLSPVIDFDWVFLAGFPHEAVQIIPTLGYFDATRLKIIGGPSWVTKNFVKEQKNLGPVYFIGEDPKDLNPEILKSYQEISGKPAGLIELIALDAFKLGSVFIKENPSSRSSFDRILQDKKSLEGVGTNWNLVEGIWIKQMTPMTISQGEFIKIFALQ